MIGKVKSFLLLGSFVLWGEVLGAAAEDAEKVDVSAILESVRTCSDLAKFVEDFNVWAKERWIGKSGKLYKKTMKAAASEGNIEAKFIQGLMKEDETLLEEALQGGCLLARCVLGALYINKGKTEEGLVLLEQAMDQDPTYSVVPLVLASYYKKKGDLEEALSWYRKSAEKGCAQAQYKLGKHLGGKPETEEESRQWLKKAAEQGHEKALEFFAESGDVEAQYRLGKEEMWIDWLAKAARKGHAPSHELLIKKAEEKEAEALFVLGSMYEKGEGVDQNLDKALEWYVKALELGRDWNWKSIERLAEGGHVQAQYLLGTSSRETTKTCVFWLTKACKQGHQEALNALIDEAKKGSKTACYALGEFYEKTDPDKAIEYLKSVQTIDAYYKLGFLLKEKDPEEALGFFKAVRKERPEVLAEIEVLEPQVADLYFSKAAEEEAKGNNGEAIEFYRNAERFGHKGAYMPLGRLYECEGCPERAINIYYDYALWLKDVRAFEAIKKLEAHDLAKFVLGHLYRQGVCVEKNNDRAFEYYQACKKRKYCLSPDFFGGMETIADEGHREAQYFMGCHYSTKSGTSFIKYFEKAATQGHRQAQEKLLGMVDRSPLVLPALARVFRALALKAGAKPEDLG